MNTSRFTRRSRNSQPLLAQSSAANSDCCVLSRRPQAHHVELKHPLPPVSLPTMSCHCNTPSPPVLTDLRICSAFCKSPPISCCNLCTSDAREYHEAGPRHSSASKIYLERADGLVALVVQEYRIIRRVEDAPEPLELPQVEGAAKVARALEGIKVCEPAAGQIVSSNGAKWSVSVHRASMHGPGTRTCTGLLCRGRHGVRCSSAAPVQGRRGGQSAFVRTGGI